jgi:hypothetical protein
VGAFFFALVFLLVFSLNSSINASAMLSNIARRSRWSTIVSRHAPLCVPMASHMPKCSRTLHSTAATANAHQGLVARVLLSNTKVHAYTTVDARHSFLWTQFRCNALLSRRPLACRFSSSTQVTQHRNTDEKEEQEEEQQQQELPHPPPPRTKASFVLSGKYGRYLFIFLAALVVVPTITLAGRFASDSTFRKSTNIAMKEVFPGLY